MKEKIRELLGIGLANNIVASAVGCDDSYISQLLSDPVFAEEVQKLRGENLTEAVGRDSKWNSLEDKLLQKVENLLPLMVRPMEVIRALQVVNNAHRRAVPAAALPASTHQHVHLHLPTVVHNKFVINQNSQVVEVDGRTIATMSAKDVVKKLEARTAAPEATKVNSDEHEADVREANDRLSNIRRLTHLPVAELL